MPQAFFHRLRDYYLGVARVLRGEADAASIFPNSTDVGISREQVYLEFLRQHAPSKCNVFPGGFLFDDDGNESGQLDIIVTTDTTPRFNLSKTEGVGKSFSPVEGTLGVVSVKSKLNKKALEDALSNIASIPAMKSLKGRVNRALRVNDEDYQDWPYKVVYATDGLREETILKHVNSFYEEHPEIPIHRRPHLIHVAGKYVIMRRVREMEPAWPPEGEHEEVKLGTYLLPSKEPDLQAIVWVLDSLQDNAAASAHIYYSYGDWINKVDLVP